MVEVQRLRLRELVQTLAFSGITTLVLNGGRIVEAGSHTDLMARGGHYASLYEMQAGRYR